MAKRGKRRANSEHSDIGMDSSASSPDREYTQQQMGERTLSEYELRSSSEEGYYTSTSPDTSSVQREDTGIFELRTGHVKTLPPLRNSSKDLDAKLYRLAEGLFCDQDSAYASSKPVDMLGLSPRLLFSKKSRGLVPGAGSRLSGLEPPGSPTQSRRHTVKGLSSFAGSLNNLAAIPELERENSIWRPLSRRQKTGSFGESNEDISAETINSNKKLALKAKPHHVPPMSHKHEQAPAYSMWRKNTNDKQQLRNSNKQFLSREKSFDKSLETKEHFLPHSQLSNHSFKEHTSSTSKLLPGDENLPGNNKLQRELSNYSLKRGLYREQSKEILKSRTNDANPIDTQERRSTLKEVLINDGEKFRKKKERIRKK